MDLLSVVCIALGALAIVSRGPLLLAPEATVRVYRRLIASGARVRVGGLVAGLLAAGILVGASRRGGSGATVASVLGWLLGALALLPLLAPASYQRIAFDLLSVLDPGALRALGAMGVGLGIVLIGLGLANG